MLYRSDNSSVGRAGLEVAYVVVRFHLVTISAKRNQEIALRFLKKTISAVMKRHCESNSQWVADSTLEV